MADKYRLCPFYDHGASLMSDTTMDYPLGCDVFTEKGRIKPKTFCTSFDEQLDIVEALYGKHVSFTWNAKDIENILRPATMYEERILMRVRDLLLDQRRKYNYLFE